MVQIHKNAYNDPICVHAVLLERRRRCSAGVLLLAERPTRVRFVVLGYLCALTFILYLDRVCIGQAGPRIRVELRISETELGYVFAAFGVAYSSFMPFAGRLADRFGSRVSLTVIVLWWSLFTSLTGLAAGFAVLLIIRFLFGMGEAGALLIALAC